MYIMDEPILSIIVPSYNTSCYIEKCLPHFVSDKLLGKIIVYLVDDGSTDDTSRKLKLYESKFPCFFKYIHKDNGGHGSVINYGIYKLCKSKYFKIIDGDDWVDTENLIKFVDYLYNTDTDIVITNFTKVTDKGYHLVKCWNGKTNNFLNYKFTIHSLTYKLSLFLNNDIKLTENVFYEDNEYDLFPLAFAKNISYFDSSIYFYQCSNVGQSISIPSRLKRRNDHKIIFESVTNFLKSTHFSNNNVLECFYNWAVFFALEEICLELLSGNSKKEIRKAILRIYKNLIFDKKIKKKAHKNKYFKFLKYTNYTFISLYIKVFPKRIFR